MDPNMLWLLLLIITFVVAIFLAWFFIYRARTKERLLLIEKGIDLNKIPKVKSLKFPWLKIGIIFICGSIGVVLGGYIDSLQLFSDVHREGRGSTILDSPDIFSICFMYFFGGIGMVLAHYLEKNKKQA